uniref:Uncharacterized protein n=1 Tax=Knipowitschia caucasica TaxID=637954 RepID=A0AAV2L4T2_KNICA
MCRSAVSTLARQLSPFSRGALGEEKKKSDAVCLDAVLGLGAGVLLHLYPSLERRTADGAAHGAGRAARLCLVSIRMGVLAHPSEQVLIDLRLDRTSLVPLGSGISTEVLWEKIILGFTLYSAEVESPAQSLWVSCRSGFTFCEGSFSQLHNHMLCVLLLQEIHKEMALHSAHLCSVTVSTLRPS